MFFVNILFHVQVDKDNKDGQDLPDFPVDQESQDLEDRLAQLEMQEHQDFLAYRVIQVPPGRVVHLASLEDQVLLVREDYEEDQDLPEIEERLVHPAPQDSQVLQVSQAALVNRDGPDHQVLLVRGDHQDFKVNSGLKTDSYIRSSTYVVTVMGS